jgi:hypothetical protein
MTRKRPLKNQLSTLKYMNTLQQKHNELRHCATSRKDAGSIPVEVIGILNPSGRMMSLGSTQPLKEMSTRGIFRGGRCTGLCLLF